MMADVNAANFRDDVSVFLCFRSGSDAARRAPSSSVPSPADRSVTSLSYDCQQFTDVVFVVDVMFSYG